MKAFWPMMGLCAAIYGLAAIARFDGPAVLMMPVGVVMGACAGILAAKIDFD